MFEPRKLRPVSIEPRNADTVVITPIKYEGDVAAEANKLHDLVGVIYSIVRDDAK